MTSAPALHTPVLLREVVNALLLKRGQTIIDCTVGGGGHTQHILEEIGCNGVFVAIDQDPEAIKEAEGKLANFKGRYSLVRDNFRNLDEILRHQVIDKADGILLDLGVSSFQLSNGGRGFSFQYGGPLDMRMNSSQQLTAGEIVNHWPVEELSRIFLNYGDVENARGIAERIVQARARGPICDTVALADVVGKTRRRPGKKTHPATRVFQAIRIAVNDELGALEDVLPQAVNRLKVGGRLCVISFHSLEDRIVKQFFRRLSKKCICPVGSLVCTCRGKALLRLVTTKPIKPGDQEVLSNPRSRSAKLRVAEKMNEFPA